MAAISNLELYLTNIATGVSYTIVPLVGGYSPSPGNGSDIVTESIQCMISGTEAEIKVKIQTVNLLLDAARRYADLPALGPIALKFRWNHGDMLMASVVLDGQISLQAGGLEAQLQAGKVKAQITIKRRGWWDATISTNTNLYNGNGSSVGPLNLYNCDDRSGVSPNVRSNWVYLKSDANYLQSDLPMPVRLAIQNKTNDTDGISTIYLANNVLPGYITEGTATTRIALFTMEAESGTGGSDTADAAASGGKYRIYSLTTAAETDIISWTLSLDLCAYGAGRLYHVMARFHPAGTSIPNVKFRLQLLSGSTVIWNGPQVLPTTANLIQDLGVINIPMGHWWEVTGGLNLKITAQRTTGVTETVNLDFVQFFQADDFIKLVGMNELEYNNTLYVGYETYVSTLYRNAGGIKYRDWIAYGPEFMRVYPENSNILMMLVQSGNLAKAEITRLAAVAASYYERRALV